VLAFGDESFNLSQRLVAACHRQRSLPHSSSASRFTADAAGCLTFATPTAPRLRLVAVGPRKNGFSPADSRCLSSRP
jgi:hypothetical protein